MNWYAIWLALVPLFIAIYFLYEDKDKKKEQNIRKLNSKMEDID